jgi:glycosyltransferase involved in cell wall biosynthesis
VPTVFFAFRDAPERRAALATPGALDRYRLFGLDEIRVRGAAVRHNLERPDGSPAWAYALAAVVNRLLRFGGGYGGDFASAFGSLRAANEADVVFATADTVGIPLLLLKRARLLRSPLVYASIGLPERLVQLRGPLAGRLFRSALRTAHTIVAYSQAEADWLRGWLHADRSPEIVFVPFGVDAEAFRAVAGPADVDVVSVGADPRRDFDLLVDVAERHPELSFHIVATRDRAGSLPALPDNVSVESDLSLEQVRDRLAAGRVVGLPVRANSYSGATTVLLQAMALAKPVVVSRTDAISTGYGLADRANCRLVEPGDSGAFEQALLETLAEPGDLGDRARDTVKQGFTWDRYTGALWDILSRAWERDRS